MESEKVKEIKEFLEILSPYGDKVKYADILTLINELESEKDNLYNLNQNLISDKQVLMSDNERLNECYKVKAYDKLRAENKKLKARIAELEKENATLISNNADGGASCHWCIEQHEKKASKETAERDFNTIVKALETKKASVITNYGIKESVGADVAIRKVKELAKSFGVEIKE